MFDEVAMQIATGAAGNIIAYMLNGRVDALRAQVARMFRHGTEQERSAALRAMDEDAAALSQRRTSETDLTGRWSNLLLSYLTAHPEARGDIEAFGSSPVISDMMNVVSQSHYGSGPNIGRDNYGNMSFNG
jgi:hypothetical protein